MLSALLAVSLSAGPALIDDDFPRALAEAKKSGKLLFVDAWAPWCHSCIFMRQHVLNQPAFEPLAAEVVFAAIDTEKAQNAPFLEKYPVEVWPTLFLIDPKTEAVAVRWAGSADAVQLAAMVEGARGKGSRALAEADRSFAKGSAALAAKRYLASVEVDPSARALLSTLAALSLASRPADCARTAVERRATLESEVDRIAAVGWGLSCALALEPGSKERAAAVPPLLEEARAGVRNPRALADDRSGLYELLVTEREAAHDGEAARKLALEWLSFLEAEAAKAPTPAARAVFDPHRVSAAIAAHVPARALGALTASEADFPRDYNPAARLALLFLELGRLEDALAAADRALHKCTEGPRKLRLYETKARVLAKQGDLAGQRAALTEAVAYARALPKGQRSEKRLAEVEAALAALGAP